MIEVLAPASPKRTELSSGKLAECGPTVCREGHAHATPGEDTGHGQEEPQPTALQGGQRGFFACRPFSADTNKV